MRRLRSLLLFPACAALVVSAGAQDPAAVESLSADDLRIPLHSAPDDPVGGAYGLWAAGPTYKASFHDGFAFFRSLGQAG